MRERPIIMSGDNPRLILEGRKTQTRRLVKWLSGCCHGIGTNERGEPWPTRVSDGDEIICPCPYGVAGDRLWVREAHWRYGRWVQRRFQQVGPNAVEFQMLAKLPRGSVGWHKRPSIHMPRWASRITLEITKVRVERLQDISEEDATAEGMPSEGARLPCNHCQKGGVWPDTHYCGLCEKLVYYAVAAYRQLWDKLHGKGAWDKNPWVWVIEFKPIQHHG